MVGEEAGGSEGVCGCFYRIMGLGLELGSELRLSLGIGNMQVLRGRKGDFKGVRRRGGEGKRQKGRKEGRKEPLGEAGRISIFFGLDGCLS